MVVVLYVVDEALIIISIMCSFSWINKIKVVIMNILSHGKMIFFLLTFSLLVKLLSLFGLSSFHSFGILLAFTQINIFIKKKIPKSLILDFKV